MRFLTFTATIVLAFTAFAKCSPTVERSFAYQTIEEFNDWLATTDSEITFVGEPIDKARGITLGSRSALNTIVTYCNTRAGSVCSGLCSVYNGGEICLNAPGTNCIKATHNVAFCNDDGCGGTCNDLDNCGVHLDDSFCWTPGTSSIAVGTA